MLEQLDRGAWRYPLMSTISSKPAPGLPVLPVRAATTSKAPVSIAGLVEKYAPSKKEALIGVAGAGFGLVGSFPFAASRVYSSAGLGVKLHSPGRLLLGAALGVLWAEVVDHSTKVG